jgi:hypothetical protein
MRGGLPSNLKAIQQFNDHVMRNWLQTLRRRSLTDHTTWGE